MGNLLILERSSGSLSIKKDNAAGEYIMEGIFGEMGIKNKNGREYEEAEYLPQIESLQDKIKKSKLMGELDHPQNFDISLNKVSHVIEDISYDKETRRVRGRIRLLNTTAGKQAKALVDDGIPLHISSRAAGVVESSGKVKIKKLFTFDLVADPGFENAQLNRINESFGLENDENIAIYEIDQKIPGDFSSNINDKYNTKENNKDYMSESVNKDDFNVYSKHISKQLNKLKEDLENIKSVKEENASNPNEDIAAYANKLGEKLNETISYVDKVSKTVNSIIDNVKNINEGDGGFGSQLEDIKSYIEHVAEMSDKSIRYIEDVATKANKIIEHNDHVVERVNYLAEHNDHLAEGLNNLAEYNDYLKGNIETIGQYGDYTSEQVKANKKALSLIKEDRAEDIEDDINKMGEPKQHSLKDAKHLQGPDNKENEEEKEITESFNNDSYKSEITDKLNLLIESAKKQTADMDGDLHFLRFMSPREKDKFHALNEGVKAQIIEAAKNKSYTSGEDVNRIVESVISPADNTPLFIKEMPNEYRASWDNSSKSKRSQIIAEARTYSLSTPYQINNFWSTRDFRESDINFERVNENEHEEDYSTENNEYLSWFKGELAKKFNNAR